MNGHLTDKQLTGHIHQTLRDDEREALDRHLTECATCRERLGDQAALQRRIRYGLSAEVQTIRPSATMTFANLAPRLKPPSRREMLVVRSRQLLAGATALAALAVMVLILIGLMSGPQNTASPDATPIATLSSTEIPSDLSRPVPLPNDPQGWSASSDTPQNYEFGLDYGVAHSGSASGFIKSKVVNPSGDGTLAQTINVGQYAGRRVRLSGYVKADRVAGWAGLWLRVDGPQFQTLAYDNMETRPIQGSRDWQQYDVVLDVSETSTSLGLGLVLEGAGEVWVDDLRLEAVGVDVPTTTPAQIDSSASATLTPEETPAPVTSTLSAPISPSTGVTATLEETAASVASVVHTQLANLDFEAGIDGWSASDGDAQNYASRLDVTVTHNGRASGSVWSISSQPTGVGALIQDARLDAYRGQRVRLSAYLKTELSNGTAYLLAQIYGSAGQVLYANAQSIDHTTDWQKIEIVLNVPVNSEWLKSGLALTGAGRAWIDDAQIEIVGQDVPTSSFDTSPLQYTGFGAPPLTAGDLDFEDSILSGSWGMNSSAFYTIDRDAKAAHIGSASGHIQSQGTPPDGDFGLLGQGFLANNYHGQRLRLSGYVKANQIDGWAGLWLRIDGPNNQILGFDNMQGRPIRGSSDWQKYEVVLDVPDDSLDIAFGFLLDGKGEGWVDDVQLETVGQDVPTTDYYNLLPKQPINLNFEQ